MRPIAAMLALALAGCIALGRESYTTLGGAGSAPVVPADEVPVSRERTGHGFSQDASAARASSDVVVSVCDWDAGFWFLVFPPIPLPLISMQEQPGLPDTTAVRVTFEAKGPWRANFDELALVDTEGTRAPPIRYRIVLPERAESLAESVPHAQSLEPCARTDAVEKNVSRARVAVLDAGELWLTFDTGKLKDKRAAELQLDGISRGDAKVSLPHLSLDGGSRWFWYRVFP